MLYRFDDFELDTQLFQLCNQGVPLALEPQAYSVLLYLIENRETVVTRDELMDNVWADRIVTDSSLTSRIKAIRAAFGESGRGQQIIQTVHGVAIVLSLK